LLNAIMTTNARVAALAEEPKYKGSRSRPGSTLTFALRLGRRVFVGNVGDSRTYLFRDNQLLRVTKDHSYVQNLIDAGALKEEDAWDHPDGSVITAHIGEANLKTRDVFLRLLLPGDKLLLVSDGVIDMLRDRDIAPFLQSARPGEICRALVDASNAAGGADNITALCLCCY
jgi:protein phosphatase